MSKTLVSIIIPTYNRANLIGESLDSVLAQTYQNWECIIIDDGSTDNTDDIVESYLKKDSRFKYHHRPSKMSKGANSCRNYGFEICNGNYINWFDDDDVMLQDFIKIKIEAFDINSNLVIGSHYVVDKDLNNRKLVEMKEQSYLFKDYFSWNLKLITCSVMIRKEFLIDKTLFNEKLKRGQETEFFSRLFFKMPSDTYKIVDIPLFLYRQHDMTKTHRNLNYVNVYKESQSFILVEFFKKSIVLGDQDLINACYKSMLDYFFLGIVNKHIQNSQFIFSNLISLLFRNNKFFCIEFFILGKLFMFLKKGSNKFERRWKSIKINT